jgi:hypothetical protein
MQLGASQERVLANLVRTGKENSCDLAFGEA